MLQQPKLSAKLWHGLSRATVFVLERTKQRPPTLQQDIVYTAGKIDEIKEKCVAFTGLWGGFAMWALLGFGNGYFFADFRTPAWDFWVVLAYFGGFLIEWIATMILFKCSKHYYEKEHSRFYITLALVVLFAIGTMTTQYLLLLHQLQLGIVANSAIEQVPFLTLILGIGDLHGQAGYLFFRAGLYHLAELALVFLLPTRKPDVLATLKKQREIQAQEALIMHERQVQEIMQYSMSLFQDSVQRVISGQYNQQDNQQPVVVAKPPLRTIPTSNNNKSA